MPSAGPTPFSETDSFDRSAVVALSIVRGPEIRSKDSEILLAVRHPDSNPTHPNVVSVPTARVPPVLMQSLANSLERIETWPADVSFFRFPEVRSDRHNGHHPIVFLVESILSRKLGMAERLERNRLVFSCSLFSVTMGTAHYATDNPYGDSEKIAMGNVLVSVLEGFDLFPQANASYSAIFPATLAQLERAKASGVLAHLPISLDPKVYKIGGLCIESTIHVIRHLFPETGRPVS